jgi:hypothetical protein
MIPVLCTHLNVSAVLLLSELCGIQLIWARKAHSKKQGPYSVTLDLENKGTCQNIARERRWLEKINKQMLDRSDESLSPY